MAELNAAYLATLPRWLRLLRTAFPRPVIPKETLDLYKDALTGFGEDHLLAAAQRHITRGEWFPKLKEMIELTKAQSYAEVVTKTEPVSAQYYQNILRLRWTHHEPCGEPTPDVDDCPFCKDMKINAAERAKDGEISQDVETILEAAGHGRKEALIVAN